MPHWLEPTLQPIACTPYEMFLAGQRVTCPACHQPMWLMCPKFVQAVDTAPTFTVCFFCRKVEQVGVGPVTTAI